MGREAYGDGAIVVVRGRESRPHGEGSQVSDDLIFKVTEMATTENILAVYSDRGRRQLPLEGVYRQLYRPDLYLRAYGKLYRNSGAMTPGSNKETVDAMSLEKIDMIIDVMRREA